MNRNNILIVLLLGAIALWFLLNNDKGTIDRKVKDFAIADTMGIDKIVLKNTSDSLRLAQAPATRKWKLNGD